MSDLGNKKIMAKNIAYYLKLHGKTRMDLSNDLHIPYTTVTDWLKAKTYPRIDRIELMANYFGIEKSDLVEDKEKSSTLIKILGCVAAGTPILAEENIIDYIDAYSLAPDDGEYYGLKIKGHSMEPRICDGDIVIVKSQDDVNSGELAIVIIDGNEGTCKKVMKNSDGITLIPLNPSYQAVFYSEKDIEKIPVRICGKVVKLIASF